jgi:putative peptidoglycan lipid II flippase
MSSEKKQSKKILLSSLKMAIATLLSRVLGLVREQVMAAMFGASMLTDVFHVAYRIPNMMRDLFAEGAFSSAFVPSFVQAKQKGPEEARQLLWSLFIILSVMTGTIGCLIIGFSDQIVNLFAPSFIENAEKFALTTSMVKVMAFYLFFVSLAALFMGALNSLKMFFIPALAPAFFNIIMILSMLFLPAFYISKGMSVIYALGTGVLIGGFIQMTMQIPFIYKHGMGALLPKKIFSQESKHVLKLLGPGLIGFAATQINLVIATILATPIVGAVSWLQYAFRLFQLPVGVASVSIGNSNLVHFSEAWKSGKKEEAISTLQSSYNLSFMILLPAVIGLIVFPNEIINIVFERGMFKTSDTLQTATALKFYAIGLIFYGTYKIFVPTFYAMNRQKIPVYSSIFSIIINIIFCVSTIDELGFSALALGTSLSITVNVFIQAVVLKKDLALNWSFYFSKQIFKTFLAAVLTTGLVCLLKDFIPFAREEFIARGFVLGVYLGSTVLIYGILLAILGERSLINKILSKYR